MSLIRKEKSSTLFLLHKRKPFIYAFSIQEIFTQHQLGSVVVSMWATLCPALKVSDDLLCALLLPSSSSPSSYSFAAYAPLPHFLVTGLTPWAFPIITYFFTPKGNLSFHWSTMPQISLLVPSFSFLHTQTHFPHPLLSSFGIRNLFQLPQEQPATFPFLISSIPFGCISKWSSWQALQ